jgi:hypothetical protein
MLVIFHEREKHYCNTDLERTKQASVTLRVIFTFGTLNQIN